MAGTYQLYTPQSVLDIPPPGDPRWLTYGETGGLSQTQNTDQPGGYQFFTRGPGPEFEYEKYNAGGLQMPPEVAGPKVPGEFQSALAMGAGGALQYVGANAVEAIKGGAPAFDLSTHTGAVSKSWQDLKGAASQLFPSSPTSQIGAPVGPNGLTPAAQSGAAGNIASVTQGNLAAPIPPVGPPISPSLAATGSGYNIAGKAYPNAAPAIAGAPTPVTPGWHAPAVSGLYSAGASLIMDVFTGNKPNIKKAAGAGIGGAIGSLGGPIGTVIGSMIGGSIGGRVICTELNRQGLMSTKMLRADIVYTKNLHPLVVRGYHLWAPSCVNAMRKSPFVTKLMRHLALARGREIMYQMGLSNQPDLYGRAIRIVTESTCFALACLIPYQRDWRKLYAST